MGVGRRRAVPGEGWGGGLRGVRRRRAVPGEGWGCGEGEGEGVRAVARLPPLPPLLLPLSPSGRNQGQNRGNRSLRR